MTYLLVSCAFLIVAAAVLVTALARRADRREQVVRWWRAWCAAAIVLLVLTIVFDNVMIAVGLMTYASSTISGLRIGLAPIEDLAYPIAALLLLPGLWLLRRRSAS
jgi:lycopene cyclase domain-containing protein